MKITNKYVKTEVLIALMVIMFGLFLANNVYASLYCSVDSDCGANSYSGSPFCQGNTVYQKYVTWTCVQSGSNSGYCASSITNQLQTTCSGGQICSAGNCKICTSDYQQKCSGGNLYWYDSCGNQQGLIQSCPNGCYNNACHNYYNNNCSYHSYQRCIGNALYWYDSCGDQQDLAQYCQNSCYNNSCDGSTNYYGYNNCTSHASKSCSGNSVYWYDSCGNQQDLYSNCSTSGQTCQYGQCTLSTQTTQTHGNYVAYNNTTCYNGSLYWYDSNGVFSGLYKSCADNNSCTQDTCSGDKCLNTLKCDGSTCAVDSADYKTYCPAAQTSATAPTNGLSISLFTKQDSSSNQWQKTTQVSSDGAVYFMISAVNNSTAQVDNINVSAKIPNEISSIKNLQLNGIPIGGDISSGINIGSLIPAGVKSITFEGKAQNISETSIKQVVATSNVSGKTQSDSVAINLNPGSNNSKSNSAIASVSSAPATTGFWGFVSKWYLWIIGIFVLIILFIVVFRRLSSEA